MSIVTTDSTYYSDIGDAIRTKLKTTDTYTPSEMADAINSISAVNGVKGDAEEEYRNGYVSISAENVGALGLHGTADKAVADALGNEIANTYETIAALSNTGDETTPIYIDSTGSAKVITSYSGNAATATKLKNSFNITINGVTKSTDGSSNVEFTGSELHLLTLTMDSEDESATFTS